MVAVVLALIGLLLMTYVFASAPKSLRFGIFGLAVLVGIGSYFDFDQKAQFERQRQAVIEQQRQKEQAERTRQQEAERLAKQQHDLQQLEELRKIEAQRQMDQTIRRGDEGLIQGGLKRIFNR